MTATTMSTTEHPLEDAVRAFLREHWQRGNQYVKIARIAKAIDEDPRAVTPAVRVLVHDGTLEVWSDPERNAKTYRIDGDPRPVWEQQADEALGAAEGESE